MNDEDFKVDPNRPVSEEFLEALESTGARPELVAAIRKANVRKARLDADRKAAPKTKLVARVQVKDDGRAHCIVAGPATDVEHEDGSRTVLHETLAQARKEYEALPEHVKRQAEANRELRKAADAALLDNKELLARLAEGPRCALVIPGTFIACGEGGNYCSSPCWAKAEREQGRKEGIAAVIAALKSQESDPSGAYPDADWLESPEGHEAIDAELAKVRSSEV